MDMSKILLFSFHWHVKENLPSRIKYYRICVRKKVKTKV
jgi:hypothetical protein